MLVKICGITRERDAAVAVEAGARALGFIFWPNSPRYVDTERARRIVRTLPPFVTPVGVFVNQPLDEINTVAARVGLGVVQLHGDEDPDFAGAVERPVLKAITAADDAARWPGEVMLLIDAHDPIRRGGTGATADWSVAATLAGRRPLVLAGGLDPGNIRRAIDQVRPFGVDVSSGVETSPGLKDHDRIRALFRALREDPAEMESRG